MKGLITNKSQIFLCMGMIVTILSGWNIYNHAKQIAHIALVVDARISDATKKNIECAVYTAYAQSKPDANSIRAIIAHQFPCIKSVHVSYQAPNLVCIDCKARKPYCLLNYDFVLTAEALPVHKNAFQKHEFEYLHRIMLNAQLLNNQDALNACKECIAGLSGRVFDTYEVAWSSPVKIWLHDKKNNFSVMFDKNNLPNAALLAQCNQVKDELQQKGVLHDNRNRWIADVRFSNQIIVNKGTIGG